MEPELDPEGIAANVLADLLPGPWPLAAAIRDLPADVLERLPEGTIARFFELIPGITGDEARDVWITFTRRAPS